MARVLSANQQALQAAYLQRAEANEAAAEDKKAAADAQDSAISNSVSNTLAGKASVENAVTLDSSNKILQNTSLTVGGETYSGVSTADEKNVITLPEGQGQPTTAAKDASSDSKKAEYKEVDGQIQVANLKTLYNQYTSTSGARLTNFEYNSGSDDNKRRAYFIIDTSNTEGIKKLKENLSSKQKNSVLLDALTSNKGYQAFILTGLSINWQEKQTVVATTTDEFSSTFTGKEPQVLSISGMLPFDTDTVRSSWFIDFLNAYMYIFRASTLATYRLKLKLVIPELSTYTIYPINFSTQLASGRDTLPSFSMGAILTTETLRKAWGISAEATAASNANEKVEKAKEEEKKKEERQEDSDPATVVENAKFENYVDTSKLTTQNAISMGNSEDTLLNANKVAEQTSKVQSSGAIDQEKVLSFSGITGNTTAQTFTYQSMYNIKYGEGTRQ